MRYVVAMVGLLGLALGSLACGQTAPPAGPTVSAAATQGAPTVQAAATELAPTAQAAAGQAATAVAGAPDAAATAFAAAPGLLANAQTLVPGLQSTAVAAATSAADALQSEPVQQALRMVSSLLLGVHLDVALTPPDAPPDQVTHVALSGTDASGAFGHLDSAGQRAAATAALIAMGQIFPGATIDLAVVDDGGHPLLSASKAPGAEPNVQPAS